MRAHWLLLWLLLSPVVMARPAITLVSSQDTHDSPYGRWLALIYGEAFARLGYDFTYQGYPGGRAPRLAEQGRVDGEIHRGADYALQTDTLLRVPEPHFHTTYAAYACLPGVHLAGWQSLSGSRYRVEFRRGARQPEMRLNGVLARDRLFDVATPEQGLRKLLLGRSDLYVEQALVVEALKQRHPLEFAAIYQAGVMEHSATYTYLNRRHQALLPALAATLRTMKAQGLIERYRQQALRESDEALSAGARPLSSGP